MEGIYERCIRGRKGSGVTAESLKQRVDEAVEIGLHENVSRDSSGDRRVAVEAEGGEQGQV